jgi:hypothetical protein
VDVVRWGPHCNRTSSVLRIWCETKEIEPLPAAQIGLLLADMFDGAGISIAEQDGK